MNNSYKLLLSCLRFFLHKKDFYINEIKQNIYNLSDWNQFIEIVKFHHLLIITTSILSNPEIDNIPKQVIDRMKLTSKQKQFYQLLLAKELFRVINFFKQNDIEIIPLKGPILGKLLYNNFTTREASDLDILIDRKDTEKACQCLVKLGYINITLTAKHNKHCIFYLKKTNVYLEVHTNLYERYVYKNIPNDFNSLKTYSHSIHLTDLNILESEYLFEYVCCHAGTHAWKKLFWLVDIALLLKNSSYILNNFQIKSEHSCLANSIKLCNSLFHIGVDTKININHPKIIKLESLTKQFIFYDLFKKSFVPTIIKRGVERIILVKINSGIVNKLRTTFNDLFPNSEDYKTFSAPNSLHFLFYLLKPYLVMRRKIDKINITKYLKLLRIALTPRNKLLKTKLSNGVIVYGYNKAGYGGRGIYLYNENIEPEFKHLDSFLEAGDVFFDVGANSGIFTLKAAKHVSSKGLVIAFEPEINLLNILNYSIQANNFSNIRIRNFCIGKKTSERTFWLNDNKPNIYSFNKKSADAKSLSVFTAKLDDIIKWERVSKINYLKIDAEGSENEILLGAVNCINKFRPIVQAEGLPSNINFPAEKYNAYLFKNGINTLYIPKEHKKNATALKLGWQIID